MMVLRGCIGGCQNFLKTNKFIAKVLDDHGKKLIAPIILDPYLFRYYGVKKVPEFVFAKDKDKINVLTFCLPIFYLPHPAKPFPATLPSSEILS